MKTGDGEILERNEELSKLKYAHYRADSKGSACFTYDNYEIVFMSENHIMDKCN